MSSPETRLAEFVAGLSFQDVPESAVRTIRRAFVDTVGVTLAGTAEGAGRTAYRAADVEPEGTDVGSVLGTTSDGPPAEVALRLGTAGHGLDYDDLSWAMDGHPSVCLVPAILALDDECDATGRDWITAYAAGFEVESALADPISPEHYESGWHATATFGAFGAAAAAAKLLGLDEEQTRRALNVAASTPSGLKRNFGSMTKPLHAGLAARSGVTAALLAADGFTADAAAISGENGFWDLYGTGERSEFSVADGWALESEGIHVKAYPCCYFTHTSIAATRHLVTEHGLSTDAVRRVKVRAARGAADALQHGDPETGLEAKFSMEYAVASAVVNERVGLATFEDDAIGEPAVQRIRERVDFTVDDSLAYDSHEATVRIVTDDGEFTRRQENPPGTHSNPLSEDRLRAKFTECASRALPAERVDEVYDGLARLESLDDVSRQLSTDR